MAEQGQVVTLKKRMMKNLHILQIDIKLCGRC